MSAAFAEPRAVPGAWPEATCVLGARQPSPCAGTCDIVGTSASTNARHAMRAPARAFISLQNVAVVVDAGPRRGPIAVLTPFFSK